MKVSVPFLGVGGYLERRFQGDLHAWLNVCPMVQVPFFVHQVINFHQFRPCFDHFFQKTWIVILNREFGVCAD
jgi:hypothetical protein